jgi:hypothetical protein
LSRPEPIASWLPAGRRDIIDITNPRQNNFLTERRLRQIAQLPIEKQYEKFQATLLNKNS